MESADQAWARFLLILWAWVFLLILVWSPAFADQEACETGAGRLVSVQGEVEIKRHGVSGWQPAARELVVCPGDQLRVAANSRAAIELPNETVLRLDEKSSVHFSETAAKEPTWLDLLSGAAHFISRVPHVLRIKTPFVNAAVEGTEFLIRVESQAAIVWVYEGRVLASNAAGQLVLASGEVARAEAGQPPVPWPVIRPRDAVQWALYYPPILDYRDLQGGASPLRETIQTAFERYRQGRVAAAIELLNRVPQAQRTVPYYLMRAGLLLSVGRVDKARADIQRSLSADPSNGVAHALLSIIAVVRNDREEGLRQARQAVTLSPNSPVSHIALSYVQQARFDLNEALASVHRATELVPRNALAWARLAELRLAMGDLKGAVQAAQHAVSLEPQLARTQTVLGFAHLTRVQIEEAIGAFAQAVEFDQADPLPRLGRGLAMIRHGKLSEGRRQIEIAAALDPNSSLIRSYLGKAYYEEKRGALAGTELVIAKALDPNDPTPWLYDAIRKQTKNRPVEALHDLQQSIELNDNRAVYRSKLLLDEDLAARSVNLARIYTDLGFDQLALAQAWKSVSADPSSFSAHRFLADSYAALPRHEIARVSELLQSQLLQPLNIQPLQPQLAVTNLAILEGAGPADSSFNEYSSLFVRNGGHLFVNGVFGSNETWGDDLVVSGIDDQVSASAGQFHYETEGFRENNDLQEDIVDALLQARLSPAANLQFEWRSRETEYGDIHFRFDPEDFSTEDRRKIDTDLARVGYRHKLSPQSDLLVSLAYEEGTDESFSVDFSTFFLGFPLPPGIEARSETASEAEAESYTGEVQYLFRREDFNTVLGGGHFEQDAVRVSDTEVSIAGLPLPPPPLNLSQRDDLDIEHTTLYGYSNFHEADFTLTVGLSYDNFDSEATVERSQLNPKLGLRWDISQSTTLRFAALRALKRAFLGNQTLEPTQVAGFSQFFDDLNGSDTKRYGAAVDHVFSEDWYGGLEFTWREVDVPQFPPPEGERQNEQFHRGYFYWTPGRDWSVTAELQWDMFNRDVPRDEGPCDLRTVFLPLELRHFSSQGFFWKLGGTYVHQEVEFPKSEAVTSCEGGDVVSDNEQFWVADAEIGYRLSRRLGIISALVKNVFDEAFRYQDRNFQTTELRTPRFLPERTFFVKLALSF